MRSPPETAFSMLSTTTLSIQNGCHFGFRHAAMTISAGHSKERFTAQLTRLGLLLPVLETPISLSQLCRILYGTHLPCRLVCQLYRLFLDPVKR